MTGNVTKRSANSWQLKYELPRKEDAPNKRVIGYTTVHVATKKEAQAELRKILAEIDAGAHVEPQKLTVAQWVDTWLTDYMAPSVSAKTFERYKELLLLHLVPNLGTLPLQKLTPSHIQRVYTKLRATGKRGRWSSKVEPVTDHETPSRGLSERTLLHFHRVLSQCFDEARRKNKLARNPIEDVKAPRPSKSQAADEDAAETKIYALERSDLNTLLCGFRGRPLFPIAMVAAGTGARRGEILALRWSDIDFERGTVRIQRALEETNKFAVRFKLPKNKSSRRTIGIDAGLLGLLRSHWKTQAEDALKLGIRLPSDALIFPKSPIEPDVPIRPRNVSKQFIQHAKRLGFKGFRFHDLRHTHATQLLIAGVAITAVAQRLGHSSPMITLSTYGHVLKRAEDQAVSVSAGLIAEALQAG